MQGNQKKKKKRFIPYDYEKEIQNAVKQLNEQQMQELFTGAKKFEYATKTIKAGAQLDVEIYPEFTKLPSGIQKEKRDPTAQRELNNTNSRKACIRLINENFGPDDFWATFSYREGCEPKSIEQAQKNIKNYLRKVNYHRKKAGLPPTKYVYVTEHESGEKEIRCHHHIVLDGKLNRDQLEDLWTLGDRNQVRRLNLDRYGLTGLASYITKAPKGKKKWCASLGLKRPPESKSYSKFRASKVAKMAQSTAVASLEIQEKIPKILAGRCANKMQPTKQNALHNRQNAKKSHSG